MSAVEKRKPWLSAPEQVEHMKKQGISFNLIDEHAAEIYLTNSNTYYRLRSYRNNFSRIAEGKRAGQYVDLDFGMLVPKK